MQTLQQDFGPAQHGLTANDHPASRALMADPAVAAAEEIRSLRQRVALLEAELAATKTAAANAATQRTPPLTSAGVAPIRTERRVSEFSQPAAPAVMAVQPASSLATPDAVAATPKAADSEPVEPAPHPGFAQAWTAENNTASFEERVAEKAFFQDTTVDEESRSWLLEQ